MKKIFKKLPFIFILFFLFTACKKEKAEPENNLSSTNLSPAGLKTPMHFKSSKDFNSEIKNLVKLNPSELRDWNKKNPVTSLFDIKMKIEENQKVSKRIESDSTGTPADSTYDAEEFTGNYIDTNSNLYKLAMSVQDQNFASILDENGEFAIEDYLIKVTPEIVFLGKSYNQNLIEQLNPDDYLYLNNNQYFMNSDSIYIGRVSHIPQLNSSARIGSSDGIAVFNQIHHTIFDWDNKHRSATVVYNDNWLIYASIGTKVKFENKKWWGGWWQEATDGLYINYDFAYSQDNIINGGPPVQSYKTSSSSCTNCGVIDYVLDVQTAEVGTGGVHLLNSGFDLSHSYVDTKVTRGGSTHLETMKIDK